MNPVEDSWESPA